MTEKIPEQGGTSSTPTPKKEGKAPRPPIGMTLAVLGLLILEVLLPVLLAAGIVGFLFYNFEVWKLDRTLALVLFGAAVVVLSLALSVLGDGLFASIHRTYRKLGVKMGSSANARMAKMAIGGVLIPLAIVIAANFVPVPAQGTAMNVLITLSQKPVMVAPPQEIASLAIQNSNPAIKVLSIQVLGAFRSPEALTQLVRIVNEDPAALSNGDVRANLIKSISSYGNDAKAPLLALFRGITPGAGSAGQVNGLGTDFYSRYFVGSFDSLKKEITDSSANMSDRSARLAQIETAQTQLQDQLKSLDESALAHDGGDLRLDFVIDALQATPIKQDADLLNFARTTAVDGRYSSQVRGDALLLIAKWGDQKDMDGLYPFLHVSDPFLQMRALQAINTLQTKSNPSSNANSGGN